MQRSERPKEHELAAVLSGHTRFRVVSELGRGASAVVFDVLDSALDKRVALKLFQTGGTPRSLQALRKVLTSNESAGLVQIFEHGLISDHSYYVMERIEGKDLVRALRSLPDDERRSALRSAFADLTRALAFLHGQGFIHRDVKPGNVMLTDQGRVVLLDLDIISHFGEESASSETIGTPEYMSPEQLAGGMLEPASDLYALGVMLYEVLSGRLPPQKGDETSTGPHLRSDILPLTKHGIDAPKDLLMLCERLLSEDPDDRPDAHAVIAALGEERRGLGMRQCLKKSPVFIGRMAERKKLQEAYLRGRKSGAWAHVQGPVGMGKTELVRAVMSDLRARDEDLTVIRAGFGRCPKTLYGALDGVLEKLVECGAARSLPLAADPCIGLMFPALQRSQGSRRPPAEAPPLDPHEQRASAERSMMSLVANVAERGPIVVWFDDVEHATPDAVRIMQSWVRSPPKGTLIITCSSEEPWPLLLTRALEHIALSPFAPEEARELGAQICNANLRSDKGPSLERPSHAPWSVIEATLQEVSSESPQAAQYDTLSKTLPDRFLHLSDHERLVLEMLSVADRPVCYEDLYHACGLVECEVARALDGLKRRALAEWNAADRIAQVAPIVAQQALSAASAQRIAEHHAQWLRVCRGHGPADAFACVAHAKGARDERVLVTSCWDAARKARERLSFRFAADLLDLALSLAPPDQDISYREIGDTFALAGLNLRAAEAYQKAAEGASTAEKVDYSRLRARLLLCEGQVDEALNAAREVLSSVGLELPSTTGGVIASLLWNKAMLSISRKRFRPLEATKIPVAELARVDALWTTGTLATSTDALLGVELSTRCTRRALRCGDPQRVARALLYEALNGVVTERPPFARARRLIAQAAGLTEGKRDPALDGYVRMVQGVVHFFSGEPTHALQELDAADDIFRRHTVGELNLLTVRQFSLQSLLMAAQVRTARTRTEHLMNQAEARGDYHALTLLTAVGAVPTLLFTEDDPNAARAALASSMRIWPNNRVFVQHLNAVIAELIILEYERKPGMVDAIHKAMAPFTMSPLFRAPVVHGIVHCFVTYGCLIEAAYARGSARKPWIERARKDLASLERAPFGFTQRRAIQLAPQLHLIAGDKEAAYKATVRARAEFLTVGQDVNWTDVVLGRLSGTVEGSERAQQAYDRMLGLGYRNVERAFACTGVDLIDRGML